MGFLGFRKKKILDLTTGRYSEGSSSPKIEKAKEEPVKKPETKDSSALGSVFNFFDKKDDSLEKLETNQESDENFEDKKKKLAKRLLDITTRLEDLSNQIYRIQQRLEVLERKAGIGY